MSDFQSSVHGSHALPGTSDLTRFPVGTEKRWFSDFASRPHSPANFSRDLHSGILIKEIKSCAVKSRVVSSRCDSCPATGRSRRKHLGRFKEVTNWTEALQEKAPLGS